MVYKVPVKTEAPVVYKVPVKTAAPVVYKVPVATAAPVVPEVVVSGARIYSPPPPPDVRLALLPHEYFLFLQCMNAFHTYQLITADIAVHSFEESSQLLPAAADKAFSASCCQLHCKYI